MSVPAEIQRYVQRWLSSPQAEPPLLLYGGQPTQLSAILTDVLQAYDYEVVRLTAPGASIPIRAVREMRSALNRTTIAQRRLVILEGVERLSPPAAQALLKPLEEPAATSRYLLTCRYPRRLPATIRSRCQLVRIPADGQLADRGAEMEQFAAELEKALRRVGPSADLRLAYMRLRDYYHIVSVGGNEKLAREVVNAYWPPPGLAAASRWPQV
ncbi:MAG: hypothetical protein HY372_02960 [Candidatus Andersenbacteria bacterium]|nr:hypothetical protein [Candidatus Andersenbacteria bacterium]